MRFSKFLLGICFLAGLLGAEENWQKFCLPYQEALQVAKDKNKPIFIAFVGLNWCPWSKKISTELLAKEKFWNGLNEEVVVTIINVPEVDYCSDQAVELKEKYKITQLPTFLLLDPKEGEIARIGYTPSTEEDFRKLIKETILSYAMIKTSLERMEDFSEEGLQNLYLMAKDIGCKRYEDFIMARGLKNTNGPFFLLEKYASLVASGKIDKKVEKYLKQKIIERDFNNEKGAQLKLALLEFKSRSDRKDIKENLETVLEPIKTYLKTFGAKDAQNVWQLELTMSQFLFSKGKIKEAIKHARAAYDAAPEAEKDKVKKSIDYLKTKLISD